MNEPKKTDTKFTMHRTGVLSTPKTNSSLKRRVQHAPTNLYQF